MALEIATVMKLGKDEMDDPRRAGLLHDLGKLGIPGEILDKVGRLTDEENALMKQHPKFGVRILEPISAYSAVNPLVLYHHENYDGSDYPEGISGEKIPLGARILALADVYDALVSDRPYRHAMGDNQVLDFIRSEAGRKFDPKIVEAFLHVIKTKTG